MSVEVTIETVDETVVLELQDHVPAVLTIDHIPELRDELDSKVDKVEGYSLVADDEIEKLSTVEEYAQKNTVDSVAGKQGDVPLDKEDVGLGAVDNTSDADKPVSAAVAASLADKVDKEAGLGLSELSFTTADKSSLDQSEQDRHTHNNKAVIDKLSDDGGVLQYNGAPISDQAALDAKVDKVAGKSLVDDTEIAKLSTVQENATANRPDSENADKIHEHTIEQVAGLDDALLTKFDKADIAQTAGTATDKVMSQKAVTDLIMDMPSSYIPTPKPTPVAFGMPFEGGFYTGMIWNHIALSTENKTLATGLIEFEIDRSAAVVYKGQSLEIRSIANPFNQFKGTVVGAYPRGIVLNVTSISGSGTFSDWAVMSRFRVITAPKAQGESVLIALKFENTAMPTATQTVNEGWLATNAMVAAGTALQYPAAHWARALVTNGYSDWYIPARDELELMWRNLKPQAIDNTIGSRYATPIDYKKDGAYPDSAFTQGVNLNSSPQSPAYTLTDPAQTDALAFRAGGPEEFLWNQYFWSSSEATPTNAWSQYWIPSFHGYQTYGSKAILRRVRAMRRSII